jgi:RHS repeat-associated protein
VSDNTWTETGITYSNAPALGSSLGSSGTFSANAWTTVDVTAYISGNGVYNLAFSTTSSTNVSYSSREGANAPQLVIQTSSGPTNMPTFTPTSGPTPTRTNTPGPTATNTPTATPAPPFSNATFVYDGDGKRVKSTINGTITTYFVGAHYEVTGSTVTKYYYAGVQRIAMRTNGTLNYLLGDHLGSTSLTTSAAGSVISELRYKAWGEVRFASGNMPTKYQYTGQFSYESEFGLYFYNARWYDSSLGRFAQADSIIPEQSQGIQAWDRYAYANNNPVLYDDPTGHKACGDGEAFHCNNGKRDKRVSLISPEKEFTRKAKSPLHEEDGPVNYSGFAGCNTYHNDCSTWGWHPALDSRNVYGDNPQHVNWEGRPIYATESGVVIRVGASDWGNYVMIKHEIQGETFYSIYAHLSEASVEEGTVVDSNTQIGEMGGTIDDGGPIDPHLHFEVRKSANVSLPQANPFQGKVYWPHSQDQLTTNFVDLGATSFADYDTNYFDLP